MALALISSDFREPGRLRDEGALGSERISAMPCGLGLRVSGLGFKVQGLGFRGSLKNYQHHSSSFLIVLSSSIRVWNTL